MQFTEGIWIAIVVNGLLLIGSIITLWANRRTRKATEQSTQATIIKDLIQNVSDLRDQNQALYDEKQKLMVANKSLERRLNDRDAQLTAMTTQLEKYQSRKEQLRELQELTIKLKATTEAIAAQKVIMEDQEIAINRLKAKTGPLPPMPHDKDDSKKASE